MKRVLYMFLLMTVIGFTACEKKMPLSDNSLGCLGCPIYYTNKYVLEDINVYNYKIDTAWSGNYCYLFHKKEIDTVKYSDLYINIDLSGSLIAENVFYSGIQDSMPYDPKPIEQKYFINKIQSFNIYSNKYYNQPSQLRINNIDIYFRDKKGNEYIKNYYTDSEIGYSPVKIKLTQPPDTSKWVSFKVEIKDDKGNVFTAQTDSVYITK